MDHADAKAIVSTWPAVKQIIDCGNIYEQLSHDSGCEEVTNTAASRSVLALDGYNILSQLVPYFSLWGAKTPSLCRPGAGWGGIPTLNIPVLSLTKTTTTTRQGPVPASSTLASPGSPIPISHATSTLPAMTINTPPSTRTSPASDNTQDKPTKAGASGILTQQTDTPGGPQSTGEYSQSHCPKHTIVNARKVLKHLQVLETPTNKEMLAKGAIAKEAVIQQVIIKHITTKETKTKIKEGTSKPTTAKETVQQKVPRMEMMILKVTIHLRASQ